MKLDDLEGLALSAVAFDLAADAAGLAVLLGISEAEAAAVLDELERRGLLVLLAEQ